MRRGTLHQKGGSSRLGVQAGVLHQEGAPLAVLATERLAVVGGERRSRIGVLQARRSRSACRAARMQGRPTSAKALRTLLETTLADRSEEHTSELQSLR